MRFFAHDGTTTHGPAGIEELLKIPGFDGDTLVCPVGSDDSADWKPALAYAPFKKALLEAPVAVSAPAAASVPAALPPMPALAPMPVLPPSPPVPAPLSLPPAPAPVAAPPPAPVAAPAPAAKTVPCPKCAHKNLEEAVFCNACGARMDGTVPAPAPAPVAPPVPVAAPTPVVPPAPAEPVFAELPPSPASYEPSPLSPPDPFSGFDPVTAFPESVTAAPKRPQPAGKMGRLAEIEDASPSGSLAPSPAPALAPEPPAAKPAAAWKRGPVIAAFASAAVIAAGAAYVMLGPTSAPAPEPVAELSPSAPPAESPESAPTPVVFNSAPPPSPPPLVAAPAAPRPPRAQKAPALKPVPKPSLGAPRPISPKTARIPRRARKPRPAPEPAASAEPAGDETIIESTVSEKPKPAAKPKRGKAKPAASGEDPLLEALLTDAAGPGDGGAAPAAAPAGEEVAAPGEAPAPVIGQRPSGRFSLPGLDRPATTSDRAAARQAPASDGALDAAPAEPGAEPENSGLSEPGKTPPPPGIEDEPAKPAESGESDQLALVQVHEQFDFCAQLLSQGAFGDHYDTCLCKDSREASPYRGRRGYYVNAKKKEASAGRLETSAKIVSSKLGDGAAIVKARWKSGGSDKVREAIQTWRLEDGLWCQAP